MECQQWVPINCQWPKRLSSISLRFGNVSANLQNPLSHYKCVPFAQFRGLAHWSICHTWKNRTLILTLHQFHLTVVAKTLVESYFISTHVQLNQCTQLSTITAGAHPHYHPHFFSTLSLYSRVAQEYSFFYISSSLKHTAYLYFPSHCFWTFPLSEFEIIIAFRECLDKE